MVVVRMLAGDCEEGGEGEEGELGGGGVVRDEGEVVGDCEGG